MSKLEVAMTTLSKVRMDETAFVELRRSFTGELVRPGDAEYDHRRKVWNGSIDRRYIEVPMTSARTPEGGCAVAPSTNRRSK